MTSLTALNMNLRSSQKVAISKEDIKIASKNALILLKFRGKSHQYDTSLQLQMSMKKCSTLIIIIIIPTSSSTAFSNKDKAYITIMMRWTMLVTVMEDGASVSAILLL
jgi:hypothetical protein